MSVTLHVTPNAGNLVASLTFKNTSKKPVHVDKYTAGLGKEQIGRLFEITDQNGKKLRYTGISIKRKHDENDFIALLPGERLRTTVMLNEWYEFHIGRSEYSVSYEAFNPSYGEQALFKMTSNKITTGYTYTE